MKKLFVAVSLAVALVAAPCLYAEKAPEGKDKPKMERPKGEACEKTGTVEVKKAEKGEKHDSVLLKVGAETFKLLPAKDKKGIMKDLEKLGGVEITVKGNMVAANDKHPLPAIFVESFEKKGDAAKPADVKPADAPAPAPAADAPAPATK